VSIRLRPVRHCRIGTGGLRRLYYRVECASNSLAQDGGRPLSLAHLIAEFRRRTAIRRL